MAQFPNPRPRWVPVPSLATAVPLRWPLMPYCAPPRGRVLLRWSSREEPLEESKPANGSEGFPAWGWRSPKVKMVIFAFGASRFEVCRMCHRWNATLDARWWKDTVNPRVGSVALAKTWISGAEKATLPKRSQRQKMWWWQLLHEVKVYGFSLHIIFCSSRNASNKVESTWKLHGPAIPITFAPMPQPEIPALQLQLLYKDGVWIQISGVFLRAPVIPNWHDRYIKVTYEWYPTWVFLLTRDAFHTAVHNTSGDTCMPWRTSKAGSKKYLWLFCSLELQYGFDSG